MLLTSPSADPPAPAASARTRPLPGLSTAQADRIRRELGSNDEPRGTRSAAKIVIGVLREPMFMLLAAAAALYLAVGDLAQGAVMVLAAALSIGLVVAQEIRSERALESLRTLAEPMARALRDGVVTRIPARELVPGDAIVVVEGDRAPADAVLIEGGPLRADESALTGESAPVTKVADASASAEPGPLAEPGGEVSSVLFAGSMIVGGHGVAEVGATGARTQLGRIGASLASIERTLSPLQAQTRRLVTRLGVVAVAFCVVVAVSYGLVRGEWFDGALAALTLSIALVPEEFPMVLAIFLAVGAWRLSRLNVLPRRSAAVEALGSTSVLCVDKTGTLTLNRMRIAEIWPPHLPVPVPVEAAARDSVDPALSIAALACLSPAIDPMDRAVLEIARTPHGLSLTKTYPLRADRLAFAQAWTDAEGGLLVAAKGAPETIAALCSLPPERRIAANRVAALMAKRGLRVLGVAEARSGRGVAAPDDLDGLDFTFVGLLGFDDPVRPEAPAAVALCQDAGIRVVMMTGDSAATAEAIARQVGIPVGPGVMTGAELAAIPAGELAARTVATSVYARLTPDQKLSLVASLKAQGEIVAMTGDGVNDAPALRAAHIGVAMGQRGTDVAREAADIVLLDDSFASIVGGVRLGRRIADNLRRAMIYVTAIHVPVAGLSLLPLLFGLPLAFFPMHVVLMELIVDPVCSVAFEAEPERRDSMRRPPRSPTRSLFGRREILAGLLEGALVLAVTLAGFVAALRLGLHEDQARGLLLSMLITANLALAYGGIARFGEPVFQRQRLPFFLVVAATALFMACALYVPQVSAMLRVAAPPALVELSGLLAALLPGLASALARGFAARGRPAER
ncbi:cation-translocating P-type ATPase [Hansschlegelia sp. KR7-227]|uniref:cation-translocating P-type ATPase n=1 Tax=Hansschlegelia sp. KR7-227 TaxID=3400914 RepID=UPI003C0E5A0C